MKPATSSTTTAPDGPRPATLLAIGELDPAGIDGLAIAQRAGAALGVYPRLVQTALRTRLEHELGRIELTVETLETQLRTATVGTLDASWLRLAGPEATVRTVAEAVSTDLAAVPHVVDVHLVDRSGDTLLAQPAIEAVRSHLLRAAHLAVLNVDEADLLTSRRAFDVGGMRDAARRIADLGAGHVLVTGGRVDGHAIDVLYDGSGFIEFGSDRIELSDPRRLRGAGATLSAVTAAVVARGRSLPDAIDLGKRVVERAIKDAVETPWGPMCDPMAPRYVALGFAPLRTS